MPPVESNLQEKSGELEKSGDEPAFRSYFELLEAKYGDEASPAAEPSTPRPRAVRRPERAPGGGRRKEGRQWLGTIGFLLAVGAAFAGLITLVPAEWWPSATPEESAPADASPPAAADAAPETAPRTGPEPTATPGTVDPRSDRAQDRAAPARESTSGAGPPAPSGGAREARSPSPSGGPSAIDVESSARPETEEPETAPSDTAQLDTGDAAPVEVAERDAPAGPGDTGSEGDSGGARAPARRAEDGASGLDDETSPSPPSTRPAIPLPSEETESVAAASTDFVRPRKVFAPQPGYPEPARQAGESGTVTVVGTVTVDGDVRDARVLAGASRRLDRAALEAFRTWQFIPAKRGGRPAESAYRVSFNFQLDRPDSEISAPPPARPTSVPPPSAEPLPFGGDFTPPQRRVTPLPSYPQGARASGAAGDVVLSIIVEADGSVSRVDVLRGLSPPLDRAALDAVRRWRFIPAEREGEPVRVEHRVTLRFAP